MEYKELFTQQEWKTLQLSIMWVFQSVAGADNKIDSKEKAALQNVVTNVKKLSSDLAHEVITSAASTAQSLQDLLDADPREMWHGLKEVTTILEEKIDPKTALNFKKTLIAVGVHIGESSGSLFGKKFSEDEVKVVMQIGSLLKVSVTELKQPPSLDQILQSLK